MNLKILTILFLSHLFSFSNVEFVHVTKKPIYKYNQLSFINQ